MFLVFNKDKIYSYLISVGIVAFLFAMPLFIKNKQVYETSVAVNQIQETNANVIKETKEEPTGNVVNTIKEETTKNEINNR